jgi:hypothetical protein
MIMALPDYMFISETDGALHDTRVENWSKTPLRANYRQHHKCINSVADFKATLRAGAYAWPGGYPLFFIANDGEAICFSCGKTEFSAIANSIATLAADGWNIIACEINYENSSLDCAHCSAIIESAYGADT